MCHATKNRLSWLWLDTILAIDCHAYCLFVLMPISPCHQLTAPDFQHEAGTYQGQGKCCVCCVCLNCCSCWFMPTHNALTCTTIRVLLVFSVFVQHILFKDSFKDSQMFRCPSVYRLLLVWKHSLSTIIVQQTLSQRVQMAYVTVRFCQLMAFHINETKTAKFVNRPHEVKV